MKKLVVVAVALGVVGCSTPLIPDKKLYVTHELSYSAGKVALAAAAVIAIYFIFDPLAPNWEIEEAKLSENIYRLDMRMKRYHTGGAGESMQVLRRRAEQLQREQGFGGYELLTYTEGIESQTLGARRVAEGTIRLVQRLEPVKAN